MSIIPDKPVTLHAHSSADFSEVFEIEADVTDGAFRLAMKRDALDAEEWIAAEDAAITVELVEGDKTHITVFIDSNDLHAALAAEEKRAEGVFELQWTGPDDNDGVWLSGPFVLTRGLR